MIDCSLEWPEICSVTGPCIRPGGPVLTERALKVCNLPAGSRLADIGCGAGGTLEYLERMGIYHLAGLDCSGPLLREANQRLKPGRLVCSRAEILPFKDCSFDALLCECVFSILADGMAALLEFERVLKEGGFLIMSDAFRSRIQGQQRKKRPSERIPSEGLLTRQDFKGTLARSGFSLLLWEEHQRLLKEFVAYMILAGGSIPDSWRCDRKQETKKTNGSAVSYFILVAQKQQKPDCRKSEALQGDGKQ